MSLKLCDLRLRLLSTSSMFQSPQDPEDARVKDLITLNNGTPSLIPQSVRESSGRQRAETRLCPEGGLEEDEGEGEDEDTSAPRRSFVMQINKPVNSPLFFFFFNSSHLVLCAT